MKNKPALRSQSITQRVWIGAILALFCALSVIFSIVTPIFEASDELWHYPVVQYIAAGRGLPVQTEPARAGLWKQEASQPPLYYALGGLLTAWIDTSDLTLALRPNPHAAIGVVAADGNINMVAHDPAREAWPWRGTVLAVHLARLLSVALGATTVYLTYRLGLETFPHRSEIAPAAAAMAAFTPMFTFISGSVNNDNLVIPLCALALLIMMQQLFRATLARWLLLGTVIGLATLSKVNAIALLSLAALTGTIVAWRRRSWRDLLTAGIAIGSPVLLITGWWFWRNVQLYGDLLGFRLFTPYFTRAIPADLAQIWSERTSFLYGYWGNFGGLNLPIPKWMFGFYNGLLLIACAGITYYALRITSCVLRNKFTIHHSPFTIHRLPLLLIILWAIIVFVGWLAWTRTTWSSQGRLVFSALPCYSILMAAGLAELLPRRIAPYALGAVCAAMALLTAIIPFAIIAPAYARPPQLAQAQIENIPRRTNITFGNALMLLGYDAPEASLQPGESTRITLYWQALAPLDRDYSIFVHLLDENDITVQDKGPAYPGRGNLPATTLEPGQTWAETWLMPVYATAYAPSRLTWEVGLYDALTGERLPARDSRGQALGDSLRFGRMLLTRPADLAFNPVSYNLGDQMELVGFDLDRRLAGAGETVTLTLVWRAPTTPARDYTVFAHVLQPPQTKWGGLDQQPTPPTSLWKAGQICTQTLALTLDAQTPPGVYEIEIGAYHFTDPTNIERLKVLTRDGRQQQDFILLSKIRVVR